MSTHLLDLIGGKMEFLQNNRNEQAAIQNTLDLAREAVARSYEDLREPVMTYMRSTTICHDMTCERAPEGNQYASTEGKKYSETPYVIIPEGRHAKHEIKFTIRLSKDRCLVGYESGEVFDAEGFGATEIEAWASFLTNAAVTVKGETTFG